MFIIGSLKWQNKAKLAYEKRTIAIVEQKIEIIPETFHRFIILGSVVILLCFINDCSSMHTNSALNVSDALNLCFV